MPDAALALRPQGGLLPAAADYAKKGEDAPPSIRRMMRAGRVTMWHRALDRCLSTRLVKSLARAVAHVRSDERGMMMVFVGLGCFAFLAATTLSIDVGLFMTARTQAQTSADAGALAGAVALFYNDFNDRTSSGPAVRSAINTSQANRVIGGTVSVTSADVTFPKDPSGQPTLVKVDVYRTSARGNPLPTLIGWLFGVRQVDIVATATAQSAPANAETCVKPWTIPDKWIEKSSPPNGQYDLGTDIYIDASDPLNYTGYDPNRDKGTEVILKPNNSDKTFPSMYNEWAIPPSRGAAWYRDNIESCNTYIQPIGDPLTSEPGNKVGPTDQGTQALIDKDPNAYWDMGCNCVKGSAFLSGSPRVAAIPTYDPQYYESGKKNGRNADLKVANWIGVFVESISNGEVTGRITPIKGLLNAAAGPAPPAAFPRVIFLVQ